MALPGAFFLIYHGSISAAGGHDPLGPAFIPLYMLSAVAAILIVPVAVISLAIAVKRSGASEVAIGSAIVAIVGGLLAFRARQPAGTEYPDSDPVMNTEDEAPWRRRLLSALICMISLPSFYYWVAVLWFKARHDYRLFHPDTGSPVMRAIDSFVAGLTLFSPLFVAVAVWALITIWPTLSLWSKLFLGLVVLVLASWPGHFILQFIGLGYAT